MGSFGNWRHDEKFFVDGDVLLDGADADGEAAIGAGQRPLAGDFDAVGIAIIGVVNLRGDAADRRKADEDTANRLTAAINASAKASKHPRSRILTAHT